MLDRTFRGCLATERIKELTATQLGAGLYCRRHFQLELVTVDKSDKLSWAAHPSLIEMLYVACILLVIPHDQPHASFQADQADNQQELLLTVFLTS